MCFAAESTGQALDMKESTGQALDMKGSTGQALDVKEYTGVWHLAGCTFEAKSIHASSCLGGNREAKSISPVSKPLSIPLARVGVPDTIKADFCLPLSLYIYI